MLVHGEPAAISLPNEHDRLTLVQDVFGGTGLVLEPAPASAHGSAGWALRAPLWSLCRAG
jgi:hypothetical protein